ncbi:uroporphyrinogen-III synthase [Nevskia sp.]|uniref:uroporphyrinogen-III synthase n=1 Tax=Nevskia sp. TaxID=1929292 RepID=UPI0025E37389|nr:uroporphyrinogen-III synthase [Nevskia sp.]
MPDVAPAARLDGFTVLVARPAQQADALCALIEAHGGRVIRLPMIEIAPVADPAAAAATLAAARKHDRWLFTSTNAVRYAADLLAPPWPACAAVGQATAAALQALGGRDVLVPEAGDGAQALLQHPALQRIDGQRHLIVTGEQTLPDLEAGLRARGAQVAVLAVYRRIPVAHDPATVVAALEQADLAVIPSGEALRQLLALTPSAARARLRALQLAVPSPRVVETARDAGFIGTPLLPHRVSDSAYLDLILQFSGANARQRPRTV